MPSSHRTRQNGNLSSERSTAPTAAIRAALIGLALLSPREAGAMSWGEHGLFRVEDGADLRREPFCQLRAEADIDGVIFALVLRWHPSARLQAWFISGKDVSEAVEVVVAVNKTPMVRFAPAVRRFDGGVSTLASPVMSSTVGSVVEAELRDAAGDAEWFQVTAGPYEDAIPAAGLKEAVGDLSLCRKAMGA